MAIYGERKTPTQELLSMVGGLFKWLAFCLLVMAWGAAFVLTFGGYPPLGLAVGAVCWFATKWAMDRY